MPEITDVSASTKAIMVNVDELKPGFVLLDELTEVPSLKKGRVLTPWDIDEIKKSKVSRPIGVFIQERLEKADKAEYVSTEVKRSSVQVYDVSDETKMNSLHSAEMAEKVKEVVEQKKKHIRGDNYENRVEQKKEQHINKYNDFIKNSPIYQKDKTIQAIEKYAVSATDIESLETVEGIKTKDLVQKMDKYEGNSRIFIDTVIHQNIVHTPFVEDMVLNIMNDMGIQLARALLASVSKQEEMRDYLTAHSLQVMLISIVTAIEMTKLVQEKTAKLTDKDVGIFLALEKKFFSLEELINLGIAALLHDIEFKKQIPNLTADYKFTLKESSLLESHASGGFHIAKKLPIDFEVQRAVYQQHERFDGSGIPNGLLPRFFTKYTPVLMFSEYFVELTTPNPFSERRLTPREALVNILSNERTKFDGDVVYSFIRAASLFPIGSWVLLSNGEIAVVVNTNKEKLDMPIVKIYITSDKRLKNPETVNLMESELKIVKPVDTRSMKSMLGALYPTVFD